MNKPPLISVITVVHNRRATLPLTLDSVLGQTYPHVEYIVIDGASTDGTAAYLATRREELHYLLSEPDTGLYDAMNKGLDRATGDFCLFLNAGDLFYRADSLARFVAAISAPATYYFATAIMTDGENVYRLNPRTPVVGEYQRRMGLPNHQASLFPRSFYATNRYDLRLRISADDDYKLRALERFPAVHVDLPVVIFELGGLSRDLSRFSSVRKRFRDALLINRKHYGRDGLRWWRTVKYALKSVLLYALQKVTGFHWRYEYWFNKFQRIEPGDEARFRSEFTQSNARP